MGLRAHRGTSALLALLAAALLEGGALAAAAVVAGGLGGLVLAGHAARSWPGQLAPWAGWGIVPALLVAGVAALAVLAGAALALIFAPGRSPTPRRARRASWFPRCSLGWRS